MQIAVIQTQTSPVLDEIAEKMETIDLLYYASEAAEEMEFDSLEELHDSVKEAMELCLAAGIPIKGNFQRIYKSFDDGLVYDWKLSEFAYKLVCLRGNPANFKVARLTVKLIKEQHLNYF